MKLSKREYMEKRKQSKRLYDVGKKLDRLCKHVGKLTNELKKGNPNIPSKDEIIFFKKNLEALSKKRDKTRTLKDFPLLKQTISDNALYQVGSAPKKLKLIVGNNDALLIVYSRHTSIYRCMATETIGHINSKGELHMLNTDRKREVWQGWVNDFTKNKPNIMCNETIWKDNVYKLSCIYANVFLKNVTSGEYIYNITNASPCLQVSDPNIQTYDNGTPIPF